MAGADPTYLSVSGFSPLNVAVSNFEHDSGLITMLIQFGADPNGPAHPEAGGASIPVLRHASEEHQNAAQVGVSFRINAVPFLAETVRNGLETMFSVLETHPDVVDDEGNQVPIPAVDMPYSVQDFYSVSSLICEFVPVSLLRPEFQMEL